MKRDRVNYNCFIQNYLILSKMIGILIYWLESSAGGEYLSKTQSENVRKRNIHSSAWNEKKTKKVSTLQPICLFRITLFIYKAFDNVHCKRDNSTWCKIVDFSHVYF